MRPASLLLLVVLLGWSGLPMPAQVATIQVTEASAPDSPIRISGTVIVAEAAGTLQQCTLAHEARCVLLSTRKDVNFQNVSGKQILAFVASVEILTVWGQHAGETYEAEKLWGPPFAPGAIESFPSDSGTQITPERSDYPPFIPKATARTLFVQFDDGATFGDSKAGRDLLRRRQVMLEHMMQLDGIYRGQGKAAFVKAVHQPGTRDLAGWAGTEDRVGPAATIAEIRRTLATAEERLAAMTAQPGR